MPQDPDHLPTPNGAVPLSSLPLGAPARVVHVDALTPIGRRLLDLGFVPNTPVLAIRRAPLGDPVLYEVRGTRLALRRSEAERIEVRPAPVNGTARA